MLTLTSFETNKACYVPEKYIESMKEDKHRIDRRDYPYTRIHIVNPNDNFEYDIDVVESKKYIQGLIDAVDQCENAKKT